MERRTVSCRDGRVLVLKSCYDRLPKQMLEKLSCGVGLPCSQDTLIKAINENLSDQEFLAAVGLASFQPTLYKNSVVTGGLVTLATGSSKLLEPKFACEEYSLYHGSVNPAGVVTVPILRMADECAGILIRIVLPAIEGRWRTDVAESVIDHFELLVSGAPIYKCSGKVNAALCSALNKWPASLRPSLEKIKRRSHQPWELVFPLLIGSAWCGENFPITQCDEIKLRITIGKQEDLVIGQMPEIALAIDADYVFLPRAPIPKPIKPKPVVIFALDQVCRPCEPSEKETVDLRMLDFRGPVYDRIRDLVQAKPSAINVFKFALPEVALITDPAPSREIFLPTEQSFKLQLWPQIQLTREKFTQSKRFKLEFSMACSALILCFTCNDEVQSRELPFKIAKLFLAGIECQQSDPIKAGEWNWLKCGLKAPLADQRFYLLPFSREAFDLDNQMPCVANFSRVTNVELELEAVGGEWDLQIAACTKNFLNSGAGQMVQYFSH